MQNNHCILIIIGIQLEKISVNEKMKFCTSAMGEYGGLALIQGASDLLTSCNVFWRTSLNSYFLPLRRF